MATVELGEIARVGAHPAPPLRMKARLAGRLEAAAPIVPDDREPRLVLGQVPRHVHVHEVHVEEERPACIAPAPCRARLVDDVARSGIATGRFGGHEVESIEVTAEIAGRHEPRMGAHAERLEAATTEHARQENGGRIVLAERELARVLVGYERAEDVLEIVATGHELRERRAGGVRVREVTAEEGAGRREPVERGRRRMWIAEAAQAVRTRRVQHDEHDRHGFGHAPR